MPMLETNRLSVRYGTKTIVDSLSFSVSEGQWLMIVGPNHKRLLPASMFGGAVFLMLADLIARILLNPLELPIGVVTSFVGAIVFVVIFYQSRKEH